jgi:hypothetical protein
MNNSRANFKNNLDNKFLTGCNIKTYTKLFYCAAVQKRLKYDQIRNLTPEKIGSKMPI